MFKGSCHRIHHHNRFTALLCHFMSSHSAIFKYFKHGFVLFFEENLFFILEI